LTPNANGYSELLKEAISAAARALEKQKIDARYLQFGGVGEQPVKKIRVPTDAFSEFLANRAMGDCAENVLASGIREACAECRVVPYGDADQLAAGEPDFPDFFRGRSEAVRLYGKRPDLLIVPSNFACPDDLSTLSYLDSERFARGAVAAIEVRSSKFEVFKYMAARAGSTEKGRKETLSFTVKVEDLQIVYRWLERHPIPQLYCQVFFDAAFGISVVDILRIIAAEPKAYIIERDAANQLKTTIKIPVTLGRQIGVIQQPDFRAEHRVTRLGRHDAYVVPIGGRAQIDAQAFSAVIGTPLPPRP
jgi:hypothetical protein